MRLHGVLRPGFGFVPSVRSLRLREAQSGQVPTKVDTGDPRLSALNAEASPAFDLSGRRQEKLGASQEGGGVAGGSGGGWWGWWGGESVAQKLAQDPDARRFLWCSSDDGLGFTPHFEQTNEALQGRARRGLLRGRSMFPLPALQRSRFGRSAIYVTVASAGLPL